jgi:hypothetical protein
MRPVVQAPGLLTQAPAGVRYSTGTIDKPRGVMLTAILGGVKRVARAA